jgi:3'-phosphoadenosine 5'-phosphosulfate sulfotransferase (PAPS reductase)/FAD synthetase
MEENYKLSHLRELEAESIHIIREVAAEFENPVMLYSIGKDSSVMVRLAEKAFYPGKVPFPLMHIDSKWKFREMIEFRDQYAKEHGWNLIVESNMEAFNAGVGPFTHGSKVHTDLMKTQALLHGLDKYRFDAAFGGARRDEEKSRAKERIFSFRDRFHQWDPKNQRPELWDIYNAKIHKGESIRVFPLSNWTELDIWQYIHLKISLTFLLLHTGILIEINDTGGTLTFSSGHHLLYNLLNRIGITLYGPSQRPTPQSTETYFLHFNTVPIFFGQAVIISHNQISIYIHHRTFLGKIKRHNRNIFQTDVLPNIQLSPVA